MIKQIRPSYYHNKKNAQYCCLSTDSLPSYLKNGDEVYFIDTGKNYIYDETNHELVEDKSSGGSEFSDNILFITIRTENGVDVADYTYDEIVSARDSGKFIILKDKYNKQYLYEYYQQNELVFLALNSLTATNRISIKNDNTITSGTLPLYSKPTNGIPENDLNQTVKDKLNPLIVTATLTSNNGGICDKSNKEIGDAYADGRRVLFIVSNYPEGEVILNISSVLYVDGFCPAVGAMTYTATSNGEIILHTLTMNSSTNESYNFFYIQKRVEEKETLIVDLDPTSLDYSGTMNATVDTINQAYLNNTKIIFNMNLQNESMKTECITTYYNNDYSYPSFNAYIVSSLNGGSIIYVYTGITNDGTKDTYSCTIFPLSSN